MANGMNLNRWLALAAKGSTLLSHSLVTLFLLSNLLTLVIYGMDKYWPTKPSAEYRSLPYLYLVLSVGGRESCSVRKFSDIKR
ncbi:putative membrane protein [Yersinia pseudotuberculosis]|nr:putative membrane protein [Yersinia pseudotuberculosis]VEE72970.1 Uncharacterised protein [Yersinia pseudotuberculosis]